MVDHDHDRIEAIDGGKIGDEVHRKILERIGVLESKGGDDWDCRVGEYLIYLENGTPGDVFPDIGEEAWPSIVLEEECNSV